MTKSYADKFSDIQFDLLQRPVDHANLKQIKHQLRWERRQEKKAIATNKKILRGYISMKKERKPDLLTMIEEEEFDAEYPDQAIGIPPCRGGLLMRASINADLNRCKNEGDRPPT